MFCSDSYTATIQKGPNRILTLAFLFPIRISVNLISLNERFLYTYVHKIYYAGARGPARIIF